MTGNNKNTKGAVPPITKPPRRDVVIPPRAYGFPPEAFDWANLPDVETNFLPPEHLAAFAQALCAPDLGLNSPDDADPSSLLRLQSPGISRSPSVLDVDGANITKRAASVSLNSPEDDGTASARAKETAAAAAAAAGDVTAPGPPRRQLSFSSSSQLSGAPHRRSSSSSLFITAQSDWAPVHEKVLRDHHNTSSPVASSPSKKKKRSRKAKLKTKLPLISGSRTKDETREGYLYTLLKWPFLLIVGAWLIGLSMAYLATRSYIYLYEQCIAWRGKRERLRRAMRATGNYKDWVVAARQMDEFFGNGKWKEVDDFAYYDAKTVRRVSEEMERCRQRAEREEGRGDEERQRQAVEALRALVEACVKNNFVGVENPRLYSQTYYGTKNLVQNWVDEGMLCA